jgi:tetratricopeptide (TPR) repeat protein
LLSVAAAIAWFGLAAPSDAADRVKMLAGNQGIGNITKITPDQIVVELGATRKEFAVNDVDAVTFDGEPNDLTQARIAVQDDRFEDAAELLSKIDASKVSREAIATDVEFYKALAAARLALAGTGSAADAGRKLLAFERAHKDSFHHYEAAEALGDLSASLGDFTHAESFYGQLAAAPWPEYKMRAGVLAGRALVELKQFDRAQAKFDEVLATSATGKEADRHKMAATLGRGAALAGAGKSDESIKLVDQVIAKADPENLELHARAYNILGNCYKAAGKNREALLAFLHVDLLYSRFPSEHAEALANLATLWNEVDKADRATQAKTMLQEKYPNSPWAKK